MTDEEYVRSKWRDPWEAKNQERSTWGIVLVTASQSVWPTNSSIHWTKSEAWCAAAEFTRQREEEIRQMKEEIRWLSMILPREATWKSDFQSPLKADYVQFAARGYRILAREQAALAELKRGMRT